MILLITLIALQFITSIAAPNTDLKFQDWSKKHGKVYQSDSELKMREAIYKHNLDKNQVNVLNAKKPSGEFSDLTDYEFKHRKSLDFLSLQRKKLDQIRLNKDSRLKEKSLLRSKENILLKTGDGTDDDNVENQIVENV